MNLDEWKKLEAAAVDYPHRAMLAFFLREHSAELLAAVEAAKKLHALKQIKLLMERGMATQADADFYEENKEGTWKELGSALAALEKK